MCGTSEPYTLSGSSTTTITTYLVDESNPTGYAQVVAEYTSKDISSAPDNLQGYWKFHDLSGTTAPDSSGLGRNATLQMATPVLAVSPLGGGLRLNGSTEWASVASTAGLQLGSSMTLTCWVRKEGEPTLEARILGKGTASTLNYSLSEEAGVGKRLLFKLRNTFGITHTLYSSQNLEVGQWYHVACTYNGATMKLFINGVLSGSLAATGTPSTSTDALTFAFLSGGSYFNGALDEVRLYSQELTDPGVRWTAGLALSRAYAYGHDLISQRLGDRTVRDFVGYDGHGSVRLLLIMSGTRVLGTGTLPDYTYDAYGRLLATTDTTSPPRNLYRYAGEQWDADLGLSYNRARYLSPSTGRFWSMDSFEGEQSEPATLHKYLYCHADPVNNTDPSGMLTWELFLGYDAEDAMQAEYLAMPPAEAPFISFGTRQYYNPVRYLKPDIFVSTRGNKRYLEIKPISTSGVAAGVAKMVKNATAFGPAGYKPDAAWQPLSPVLRTPSGETIFVINVGGVVFYQDVELLEWRLITVGAVVTAKDLLPYLKFQGRLLLRPALARISVMAAGARTVDSARLNQHVGIAGVLALGGAF